MQKKPGLLLLLAIVSLSALAAFQNADLLRASAQRLGLLGSASQGQQRDAATQITANVAGALDPVQKTFSLEPAYQGPGTVYQVEVGDMTGDGRDDLVVLMYGEFNPDWIEPHVLIFPQLANGTLGNPLRIEMPFTDLYGSVANTALGDLNEDNRQDLIITPFYTGGIMYLVSEPGGGFAWRSDMWNQQRVSGNNLIVTDSNRDGHLDVMTHVMSTQPPYDSQFVFYYGNGVGQFPSHRTAPSEEAWLAEMAVGDLNSDGIPDLATLSKIGVNPTFNGVIARNHDGSAGYTPPQFHYNDGIQTYSAMAIADLNGDGRKDLAAVGNQRKDVLIFSQTAQQTLSAVPIYLAQGRTASVSEAMQAADLNNDGRQDLLYVVTGWDRFFYNLQGTDRMEEVATIYMPAVVPWGRDTIAIGDLNSDGVKDLAIAGEYGGWSVMHGKITPYAGSGTVAGAPQIGTASIDTATYYGADARLVNAYVSFTPPTNNGGNAISGYTVHSVPQGAEDQNEGSPIASHMIVNLRNDTTYRFYVTANNAAGVGAPSALSNPITVRDFPPVHVPDSITVREGGNGLRTDLITVNLDYPALSGGASFRVNTVDGTALAGSDYVAFDKTVTIPQGSRSATFELVTISDQSLEAREEYVVNYSNLVGIRPTTFTRSGISIFQDDAGGSNSYLRVADNYTYEGTTGSHPLSFDVVLDVPVTMDVTFDLSTAPGSAQEGVDYLAQSWLGAKVLAGQTKASFSLTVIGDSIVEPDEYLNLKFSNVVGATPVGDGVIILRNDDRPVLTLTSDGIAEGDSGVSKANFTASLSAVSADLTTFTAETFDGSGTATAGSDYVARQITGLAIPAGELSTQFSIDVLGDTRLEPNESFLVGLKNVVAATAGGPGQATIFNDDIANGIAVRDVSIAEGNDGTKQAVFSIVLSEPATAPVTFDVATEPGTAIPGIDYDSKSSLGQTIGVGEDSVTFAVAIHGDTSVEADETFTANLRNVSGAVVSDGQALARIVNDDVALLTIEDMQVVEGNGDLLHSAFFRIKLSQPSTVPVRFDIASDMMGPTYYTDYIARYGDITIDPGRTQVLYEVKIRGDTIVEEAESFNIIVYNVRNAVSAKYIGVGTIIDDDVAPSLGSSKAAAKGKSKDKARAAGRTTRP